MREIRLLKTTIRNFRAFQDETVEFPQSAGLRFLSGDNKKEPDLGSNGAGKSTLWESILWGLYGITSKGETISQLVSWEAEDLAVEITLSISGSVYAIKREGPPERVYLNGTKVDQRRIDELLGMGKVPFRHAVIFSQKLKLFPDLSIPERGALLEETLGLSQWAAYSKQATMTLSERDKERQNRALILTRVKGRLEGMPLEEDLLKQQSDWEGTRSFAVSNFINKRMEWDNNRVDSMASVAAQIEEWEAQRSGAVTSLEGQEASWENDRELRKNTEIASSAAFEASRGLFLKELEDKKRLWEEQTMAEIEGVATELSAAEGVRDALQCQLATKNYNAEIADFSAKKTAAEKELSALAAKKGNLAYRLNLLDIDKGSLSGPSLCKTCGQPIDDTQAKKALLDVLAQITENTPILADLETKHSEVETSVAGLRETLTVIRGKQQSEDSRVAGVNREMATVNREITRLTTQGARLYAQLENNESPQSASITMKKAEINPHAASIINIEKETNPYPQMITAKKAEICPHWTEYDRLDTEINPFITRIDEEKMKVNPFDSILSDWRVKRDALLAEIGDNESLLSQVEKEITSIEFWKDGFKRIRLYLMNKVLRALEIEVNSALSTLGMRDWHVSLPSETETKSGTVKFGVQIIVKSPKKEAAWEAWSGGEEQRLRIGLSLGLASLIQRASGSWWNLEVFDEPSIYLSEQGVAALLETLDYRATAQNKPIWIVDHTALTHVAFKEAWTVVKGPDGSKIERGAGALYN
jgi:DNA repair exonuclease SbcCD ATPase subunit